MAYTTIDNPELYFQTKLYTGNNSTNAITLDGSENMQPDLVWVKKRNAEADHILFDSIRGVTKGLFSSRSTNEETEGGNRGLRSFDTNGFTLGPEVTQMAGSCNDNSDTFAAWNWKAGTSFTNDASSTGIGTIDSTGSASDTSGFSIVSYTGTGSSGTIKHGLSTAPSMVIIKNRTTDNKSWIIAQKSIGYANGIFLNLSEAKASEGSAFNSTAPTSSVFTVGNTSLVNDSGDNYIAYCFADVKGYSKVSGSYTGNGNADGAFIYTGFKPAFFMAKRTDANDMPWVMIDNKRNSFNALSNTLLANSNEAANTGTDRADFLSQGVKIKTTSTAWNASGAAFIFMAFAESPFVSSSGVPTTAR